MQESNIMHSNIPEGELLIDTLESLVEEDKSEQNGYRCQVLARNVTGSFDETGSDV